MPTAECVAQTTGRATKRILVCPPGFTENPTTQDCECPAPKKINVAGECVDCEPPAIWNATTKTCTQPVAGAVAAQDCSLSSVIGKDFASLPAAQKQSVCTDITFKNISVGMLLHYSELKRRDATRLFIAADIVGAAYDRPDGDAFIALRNGSAVNRKHAARTKRGEHTASASSSGRLVYICAEGNQQWNTLWFNNLYGNGFGEGKEPWRLHIQRCSGVELCRVHGRGLRGGRDAQRLDRKCALPGKSIPGRTASGVERGIMVASLSPTCSRRRYRSTTCSTFSMLSRKKERLVSSVTSRRW